MQSPYLEIPSDVPAMPTASAMPTTSAISAAPAALPIIKKGFAFDFKMIIIVVLVIVAIIFLFVKFQNGSSKTLGFGEDDAKKGTTNTAETADTESVSSTDFDVKSAFAALQKQQDANIATGETS